MLSIKKNYLFFVFVCIFSSSANALNQGIINGGGGQVGDNITSFCLARVLSLKYGIPFYYVPFEHIEIFNFYATTNSLDITKFEHRIRIETEQDIIDNIDKDNVIFWADIITRVNPIDPEHFAQVKKDLQLTDSALFAAKVNPLPENVKTVAVHIRKGNGGGQYYDGEQSSPQLFNFDRSQISYATITHNYPFEWAPFTITRSRMIDQVEEWQMRFPPEQFYIDQIINVSVHVNNEPLFVQIFTDDKNPHDLIERIKTAINNPNIIFYYQNIRSLPYKEQIALELYSMSRHDVLIRPQSYFSRMAEIIGDHKLVIYPVNFKWDYDRLVMNKIMWKGHLY